MKNSLQFFFTIIILSSCSSYNNLNKSQTIYISHLNKIEYFVKNKDREISLDLGGLFPSIKLLENLTKIKSDLSESFESFPIPTRKNFKQWRNWYKINKDKLYFDETERIIKVNP